jgi:hypothetical protein
VKAIGRDAHELIQAEFRAKYSPFLETNRHFAIPGKKTYIISEGFPDLVLNTPTGFKVGEIKPANPEGYFEGDAKIEIYRNIITRQFPSLTFEPLDLPPVPPIPFVDLQALGCPPQALYVSPPVRGVYGYLCVPPFQQLRAECKCKNDQKPRPFPKKQEQDERKKSPRKERRTLPDLVPALEAAAATASLAAMAFLLKKLGPKLAPKVLGPAYEVASFAALAVLLGSGVAEAKVGPSEEEPLVQLFKALQAQGVLVPPEVRSMIENNPELKDKIEKAMTKGGDISAAQQALNQQVLKVIQDHKSEFTVDDLSALLEVTQAAGAAFPQGEVTAQAIRKAMGEARGAGGGVAKGKENVWERAKQTAGPTTPAPSRQPSAVPATPGARPGGSAGANVWEHAKVAGDPKYASLNAESKDKIAGAPAPVRSLFDAMVSAAGPGAAVTDSGISLFFSVVPSNLTGAQAKALIARLAPAEGQSLDQILASLKAGLDQLYKAQSPEEASAPQGEIASIKPAPANQPGPASASTIDELARLAETTDFSDVPVGGAVARWGAPDKDEISGTIRGITSNKVLYIGRYSAQILGRERNGTVLRVRFISATPMVDKHRNVVIPAAKIVGTSTAIAVSSPR